MKDLMALISTNYISGNFGPLTEERPEASIPFGGRYRIIDFQLSNVVNSGISTVGLVTPYRYRSLMDHVGVGKEWALNRKVGGLFILPGSTFGLHGAKGHIMVRDLIMNRPFLERGSCKYVLLCDSSKIMNIDYSVVAEAHEASGNDVTFITKKNFHTRKDSEMYLNLDEDGRVKSVTVGENKDGSIMLGAYIINLDLLLNILDLYEHMGYMDMIEILNEHTEEYKIGSYEFNGYVGVINDLNSYMHVSMDLLKPEVRQQLFKEDKPIKTKVSDAPPVKYAKGCDVSTSLISSGCVIEGTVENSIIFRDVHIAKGAVVRNCILMQHCDISDGVILENVVCDKYVSVKPGVQISVSPESPVAINKKDML